MESIFRSSHLSCPHLRSKHKDSISRVCNIELHPDTLPSAQIRNLQIVRKLLVLDHEIQWFEGLISTSTTLRFKLVAATTADNVGFDGNKRPLKLRLGCELYGRQPMKGDCKEPHTQDR